MIENFELESNNNPNIGSRIVVYFKWDAAVLWLQNTLQNAIILTHVRENLRWDRRGTADPCRTGTCMYSMPR